jgi:hypothetical protein
MNLLLPLVPAHVPSAELRQQALAAASASTPAKRDVGKGNGRLAGFRF